MLWAAAASAKDRVTCALGQCLISDVATVKPVEQWRRVISSHMEAEPLPESTRGLCAALQTKLQRWASLGEAPEYYELKNR